MGKRCKFKGGRNRRKKAARSRLSIWVGHEGARRKRTRVLKNVKTKIYKSS